MHVRTPESGIGESPRVDPSGSRAAGIPRSAIGLAISAAVIAVYLAWVSGTGATVAGCGALADCSKILQGRWASWLGIPVSWLAAASYAVFAAAACVTRLASASRTRILAWRLAVACGVLVVGSAAWFLSLQIIVIGHICPACVLLHGLGTVAAVIVFNGYSTNIGSDNDSEDMGLRGRMLSNIRSWIGVAVALLALLVVGQLWFDPQTHGIKPLETGAKIEETAPGRREIEILNGQFRLGLIEVPLIGPAGAQHVVVALLDYTCLGCRILHAQLGEARRVYGDQLAIACLFAPLDSACNPTITEPHLSHTNACEYARLALRVWRADRAAFHAFEKGVFETPALPSLEQAQFLASSLVSNLSALAPIHRDWVESQLNTGVSVYSVLRARVGTHAMPLLLVSTNIAVGSFRSADDLFELLEKELEIVRGDRSRNR